MKKIEKINIMNFVLLITLLVGDIFYIVDDSIYVKTMTSLIFVAIGVINAIHTHDKTKPYLYSYIMLAGLVLAFLGDVILEIHFITGAGLFALGHVMFFASYCVLEKFNWKDLIYGICIFVPCVLFIVLAPLFNFDIVMEIVCIIYALIISLMLGKSISNLVRNYSKQKLIIMIGCILFFISDFMLLLNVFMTDKIYIGSVRLFGLLCLLTYYPAEFLLGYSILYRDIDTKKSESQTIENASLQTTKQEVDKSSEKLSEKPADKFTEQPTEKSAEQQTKKSSKKSEK